MFMKARVFRYLAVYWRRKCSARGRTSSGRSRRGGRKQENADNEKPVFKVQIFVADRVLKPGDSRFKGETEAQYYREGNMVKYTIGASTNYNEIYKLRKTVAEKFPGCFIIAFKNDEKMNVNEAIREFKAKR